MNWQLLYMAVKEIMHRFIVIWEVLHFWLFSRILKKVAQLEPTSV